MILERNQGRPFRVFYYDSCVMCPKRSFGGSIISTFSTLSWFSSNVCVSQWSQTKNVPGSRTTIRKVYSVTVFCSPRPAFCTAQYAPTRCVRARRQTAPCTPGIAYDHSQLNVPRCYRLQAITDCDVTNCDRHRTEDQKRRTMNMWDPKRWWIHETH